jgi:hypothetical protein
MLGFHMSGDGKCEAHKKVMIDKVILYSNVIRNSTMWRGDRAVEYDSFYMPSLGYGVPATMLNYSHSCNPSCARARTHG